MDEKEEEEGEKGRSSQARPHDIFRGFICKHLLMWFGGRRRRPTGQNGSRCPKDLDIIAKRSKFINDSKQWIGLIFVFMQITGSLLNPRKLYSIRVLN